MIGLRDLDEKNTYLPNLNEILESAVRTYGEAEAIFSMIENELKSIGAQLKNGDLADSKEIYDKTHAFASLLALVCELYLKAIYIKENSIAGVNIEEIWNKLKNGEFKADSKGNLIYMTPTGILTFARYDEHGEPYKDGSGRIIYFDKDGNIYNERNRGSKIKRNGHQLDRLIELLSDESKLYLEARMLCIPMAETESNQSISIVDFLRSKGIIHTEEKITHEEYRGWVEQHKRTFEESRYAGQKIYNVNIEFLYHLATQIRSVAQYRIEPRLEQNFTINEDDLADLPQAVKDFAGKHPNYISESLIKQILSDKKYSDRIAAVNAQDFIDIEELSPETFNEMLSLLSAKEISYSIYFCFIYKKNCEIKQTGEVGALDNVNSIMNIIDSLNSNSISIEMMMKLICIIKRINPSIVINGNSIKLLVEIANRALYYTEQLMNHNEERYYNKKQPNNSQYINNENIITAKKFS